LTEPPRPLAGAADEATRVRLAACPKTAPDILGLLAHDPTLTVRAAVALNPASPAKAAQVLADDRDARVRALIGRRLAGMLPMLDATGQGDAQQQVVATLYRLIEDEAERVRGAIADVIKDMPGAPRDLVLRLARDSAFAVCDPVIRLSPLLTQEDLLTLLADPPCPESVTSVARRPGLSEQVADALAETVSDSAVALLLANQSAAIREATIDALVARATHHVAWHEPLVRRPILSARAARALAEFVSTRLLDELANRPDLDPAVIAELRLRLAARTAPLRAAPTRTAESVAPVEEALRMRAEGKLSEAGLALAIRNGNLPLATAMLAVAACVPVQVVERAARLRNAKAIVALVWKAGFSMNVSGPLQLTLAAVPPASCLRAAPCNAFPLTPGEMSWHLDMLLRQAGVVPAASDV
jgi:uncharacterized protein (DUF2336 family)